MGEYDRDIQLIGSIPAVPSILKVVCEATGMGFAAVARVTEKRWIACSVRDDIGFGLKPGGKLDIESTICHEIRQSREGVVFDNADEHRIFSSHHTPRIFGLKSYISMPIILSDGRFFGTLCAIDPRPAKVDNDQIINMFKLFADLIGQHIEGHERVTTTQSELADAIAVAELREQFIAVLGHDLRNPLGAITSAADLLARANLPGREAQLVQMMRSSSRRMGELIDNVLDFARGRLGAGVTLVREPEAELQTTLDQVVSELKSKFPDRQIHLKSELAETVWCDESRVAQLFSNLLANAITHGAVDKAITVEATSADGTFQLSVANGGVPITTEGMKRLFKPFARGEVQSSQQGLGLGLYIASEIAKAHGGTLEATSNLKETRFTLTLPCSASALVDGERTASKPVLAIG